MCTLAGCKVARVLSSLPCMLRVWSCLVLPPSTSSGPWLARHCCRLFNLPQVKSASCMFFGSPFLLTILLSRASLCWTCLGLSYCGSKDCTRLPSLLLATCGVLIRCGRATPTGCGRRVTPSKPVQCLTAYSPFPPRITANISTGMSAQWHCPLSAHPMMWCTGTFVQCSCRLSNWNCVKGVHIYLHSLVSFCFQIEGAHFEQLADWRLVWRRVCTALPWSSRHHYLAGVYCCRRSFAEGEHSGRNDCVRRDHCWWRREQWPASGFGGWQRCYSRSFAGRGWVDRINFRKGCKSWWRCTGWSCRGFTAAWRTGGTGEGVERVVNLSVSSQRTFSDLDQICLAVSICVLCCVLTALPDVVFYCPASVIERCEDGGRHPREGAFCTERIARENTSGGWETVDIWGSCKWSDVPFLHFFLFT